MFTKHFASYIYKPASWFKKIPTEDNHTCAIVSVDISGSSGKHEAGRDVFLDKKHISNLIIYFANHCGGEVLKWEGDGGAILFKYDGFDIVERQNWTERHWQDNDIPVKLFCQMIQLFRFCFLLRDAMVKKILNARKLDELSSKSNIADYENLLKTHFQACNSNFDSLLSDSFSDIDSYNENAWFAPVPQDGYNLRIVCTRDNIRINKYCKGMAHGDGLNFILKYERDVSSTDFISICSELHLQHCNKLRILFKYDPITYDRIPKHKLNEPINGDKDDRLKFYAIPIDTEKEYKNAVDFFASSRSVNIIPPSYLKRNLEKLVKRYGASGNMAILFNISYSTLADPESLKQLWLWMLGQGGFSFKIVIPKLYLARDGTWNNSKEILRTSINEGLTEGNSFNDRLYNSLLAFSQPNTEKFKIVLVDNTELKSNLNPSFAFAAYYFGNEKIPKAASKGFLLEPFSKWEKEKKRWEYRELLFYQDDTRIHYLKDIGDDIVDHCSNCTDIILLDEELKSLYKIRNENQQNGQI